MARSSWYQHQPPLSLMVTAGFDQLDRPPCTVPLGGLNAGAGAADEGADVKATRPGRARAARAAAREARGARRSDFTGSLRGGWTTVDGSARAGLTPTA